MLETQKTLNKIGFILLEIVFFSVVYFLTTLPAPDMPIWLWALMGVATFRMARTISFNEIAEPLRAPFTKVVPDSCGAGSNVEPRQFGLAYVIGSLLACPICTGQWSALALYTAYVLSPKFGMVLITLLSVAGVSELLHWLACLMEWQGRAGRVYSGAVSPDKHYK